MKKFLAFAAGLAACTVLVLYTVFFLAAAIPKGVFDNTYQSVIWDKYEDLKEAESPKIILVGGSSMAYGIDEALLEDLTGMRVCGTGLYGSLGELFQTQLTKGNIQEGDIVVLAYEYTWIEESAFTNIPADMVMSGIDDHLELYRYIPLRNWPQLWGYLPEFIKKKAEYEKNPGDDIHHTYFDSQGRMILKREAGEIADNTCDIEGKEISSDTVKYLKAYKKYVESRGAHVYMAAPPLLESAVTCPVTEFDRLRAEEEEKIGIPCISDQRDYLYPRNLMYDTIYHCTDEGAAKRTEQLYKDLQAAGAPDD